MAVPSTPEQKCPGDPEPDRLSDELNPGDESTRPTRYDANLILIRRRLADDRRMNKARPWWKPKF